MDSWAKLHLVDVSAKQSARDFQQAATELSRLPRAVDPETKQMILMYRQMAMLADLISALAQNAQPIRGPDE